MKKLQNKTALITGAARGIGANTARLMAAQGATVFVADRLSQQVGKVASVINEQGGKAVSLKLDVTSEENWQSVVVEIENQQGGLDILVNNAGIFLGKDFEEMSLVEWQTLVDANMTSVFLGTKLCAPLLRHASEKSPLGSAIVNVSSIAGLVAAPNDALYSMTKGGVTVFTKSTAVSFASKGDRIRVNSVHPGVVDTEMGELAIAAQAKRLGVTDTEQVRKLSAERHPVGRIATTEDIANAILFLASDDAAFMTGVSMPVDGGYTAQ
ncbi:MAG: SDR family oxidoreductase [Granulosicoccus sp.]|nr:SDR family oxidoreductase [Granulosicoccus sp.]